MELHDLLDLMKQTFATRNMTSHDKEETPDSSLDIVCRKSANGAKRCAICYLKEA